MSLCPNARSQDWAKKCGVANWRETFNQNPLGKLFSFYQGETDKVTERHAYNALINWNGKVQWNLRERETETEREGKYNEKDLYTLYKYRRIYITIFCCIFSPELDDKPICEYPEMIEWFDCRYSKCNSQDRNQDILITTFRRQAPPPSTWRHLSLV